MATNNVLDLLDLMLDNGEDSRDNNTPSVAHCDSVYFTSKADRYENISARITDGEESVRACVLSTGNKFRYVIPGFDPIGVRLCPVKVSLRIEDSVEIYDFFMKDDKSLCRSFPSEIVIKDITVVKEEDFKLCMNTTGLKLPPYGVTVIWEWEWIDHDVTEVSETMFMDDLEDNPDSDSTHCTPEDNPDSDSTHCTPEDNPDYADSDSTCCTQKDKLEKEHTVTFKCIGCTHDTVAQDTLRFASQLLDAGTLVPVDIYPEPNNPYDRRAIAFKCWVNDKWTRIGYIVHEILDDVHDARRCNQITNIRFAWVKYLVCWSRPGYYAGVKITKRGNWSARVCAYASTR